MPTPQAYDKLWRQHQDMQRAIARYLATPKGMRDDSDLMDLIDDWEPSETDQGLIPIPKGYAEP